MRARKLLKVVPLGLVVATGLVIGATPASAAYTDCSSGYACMWTSNSYPGAPNASFQYSIVLSSTSNAINSIVNNGNSSVARFYDAGNFTGSYISLNNPARGGQTRDPNLSNGTDATTANWANRISSAQFV
ncbi:peptidase inhibitor family I36 protein [Cellulomonas hominis]|uniref:peptidase inhibitor family I36 protein n=1 Tax=Cellulomonas hominis TaxID=156981 RepID=UPI001C117490|nr:peptidase inhibitor family I36 protein [Cellulomonas hominis]MBU5422553.1 peptidase inhibitor family I36 protein [Cellulomonas hominis]